MNLLKVMRGTGTNLIRMAIQKAEIFLIVAFYNPPMQLSQ